MHVKYLVAAPTISKRRPLLLDADDLPHVLVGRVGGHQVMIGQLVLLHYACTENKGTHVGLCIKTMKTQDFRVLRYLTKKDCDFRIFHLVSG